MAMVKIGRNMAPECDSCGCRGRLAPDEATAARWAHIGRWDTPGPEADDDCCEWWFRCPKCVKRGRWPLETQGWKEFGTPGDGPTIRLADGDLAADVVMGETPEVLVI